MIGVKIKENILIMILVAACLMLATRNNTYCTTPSPLEVTSNFSDRVFAPNGRIEVALSRPLLSNEGRIAVLIGSTDVSSLLIKSSQSYSYQPHLQLLPEGDNIVSVFLVDLTESWKPLAELALKVSAENTTKDDTDIQGKEPERDEPEESFVFSPSLTINIKSQNQIRTFPLESSPQRNPYTDLTGQGSFDFNINKRGWTLNNRFQFSGSTFIQEALRFGELQNEAPRIDLANYLIELKKDRFKLNLGKIEFGSNRHLVNEFSSRGLSVSVPLGEQNEISFNAANGTSVVGYGNFLGFVRKKHSILRASFAREFFKKRPGGLRVETSVLRGSLLPLENFNQGEINDAEKSLGLGVKIRGSDTNERLRFEFSLTRSAFTNPADPNLEQEFEVTEIGQETKNARFVEISFDFIRDVKLWDEKKLKLTGTYRNEEIPPLFRSVGVFTQADRRKNQFEVSGSLAEFVFGLGHWRQRDNLDDIASILKTLNRENSAIVNMPLNSFFNSGNPSKWLPTISYNFKQIHQFGAFLPTAGEFNDPSQIPDQISTNQSFNAQWMLNERLSVGLTHNRAFQNNRQTGRANADFATGTTGIRVDYKPFESLGTEFELSRERQKSFEQLRTDKTFRLATRATWNTPFFKNSVFSGGLSFSLAGDTGNLSDSRNGEFDGQWAYNFGFGEKKYKKVTGQFFIRYANRYGDRLDRQFFVNSFNKSQVFNTGLTFNVF